MTKKRNFQPNAYYHVLMRGNNRQNIFNAKTDMLELMRAFLHVHSRFPFRILAFCFMTNHYHILIKTEGTSLSKIMGLINKRYSTSYSKRYNHIGRIYQKRFFAQKVNSPRGLLNVSSYIHRNPIDTKKPMVNHLEQYPYSSYPYYCDESKPAPPFLDRGVLKYLLPSFYEQTNSSYCQYCLEHKQEVEDDSNSEIIPMK
ncbi:transposase [Psychrobacillus sp. NPDC058041]|uniref:transposase n=1 Tax=Psychrobacillus sp. NPDC058041 TaxID=3346310 RepID=UPI0036DB853C